jgi:dipeptidyl aminopeptidase/acylaminoacyl peptidase
VRLEDRGRRAANGINRAVGARDTIGRDDALERFHRFRARKERNQRIGAGLLAVGVTAAAIVLLGRAFSPLERTTPAAPRGSGGLILYGDWDAKLQQADWFTVRPDGSEIRDLQVTATCAVWSPDGSQILITNDAAVRTGSPLRPAVVDPDGSNLRPLDATGNPDLNLGCGDVSPDGRRIALEGFGQDGHPELDGIYSVRASDGGGLIRLLGGPVSTPWYSPDGTRLSFFDTKEGVSPSGSGALFVMGADGGDPVRITPWGYAFDDHAWSPDGRWIVFQRPYGELYLVHPDGSGLHRVPLQLPPGTGALNPSWSPDGRSIVLSLQRSDRAEIYMVRPDGTGLRRVTGAPSAQEQSPDWGTPSFG